MSSFGITAVENVRRRYLSFTWLRQASIDGDGLSPTSVQPRRPGEASGGYRARRGRRRLSIPTRASGLSHAAHHRTHRRRNRMSALLRDELSPTRRTSGPLRRLLWRSTAGVNFTHPNMFSDNEPEERLRHWSRRLTNIWTGRMAITGAVRCARFIASGSPSPPTRTESL